MSPELRDIHLPPAISWWPPAPGWWLLAGVLLLLGGAGLWWHRRSRAGRPLRAAAAELEELARRSAAGEATPALLRELSALLRRAALQRYPREEVAALSGTAWLHFLDEAVDPKGFVAGPGRVLGEGPYRPAEAVATTELWELCRRWLRGLARRRGRPC